MVALPWRDLGVGTPLIQHALDRVTKKERIEQVGLEVIATEHRARDLKRRAGFQEEGELAREVKSEDGI